MVLYPKASYKSINTQIQTVTLAAAPNHSSGLFQVMFVCVDNICLGFNDYPVIHTHCLLQLNYHSMKQNPSWKDQFLSQSRNGSHIMETGGSLPQARKYATCHWARLTQSILPESELLKSLLSHVFQVLSFPQVSPPTTRLHLSSPIHVTCNSLLIPLVSVTHEAPRCVISSRTVLPRTSEAQMPYSASLLSYALPSMWETKFETHTKQAK